MYHKLINNLSNSKIKIFILSYTIYMIIVSKVEIFMLDSNASIYCINMLLNIIAIGCGVVYYKITNNSNIYFFLLFYISVFIENAYFALFDRYDGIINLVFIYRTLLLTLIVYNSSRLVKLMMNKTKITLIISIMINILLIKINEVSTLFLSNEVSAYVLDMLIIATYFILARCIFKVFRNHDFVESVFLLSILSLGSKLWFKFIIPLENYYNSKLFTDNNVFFVAFSSILIAFFVEINFVTKENHKLNVDVELMANDIEKLREIELLKIKFFSNFSHELKNPINIIYSSIQVLEMKKKMNKDVFIDVYKKYDPILKQNCFKMIRLANNLVDLTKINSGFLKLDFKNVDIVQLVEDVTMAVVQYTETKKLNINIVFDTLIEEHIVKCNVDAIERIILNLLSNAIKFSYEGGEILVFVTLENQYVVIKVRDYGIGISKEKKESIFGVFMQRNEYFIKEKEGSCIGLSLVKSLVELHCGMINLSDVEVGTEAIVKIPNIILENDTIESVDLYNCEHDIMNKVNVELSDI